MAKLLKSVDPTPVTRSVEVSLYSAVWSLLEEQAARHEMTAERYIANCIALDIAVGWHDAALTYPYRAALWSNGTVHWSNGTVKK